MHEIVFGLSGCFIVLYTMFVYHYGRFIEAKKTAGAIATVSETFQVLFNKVIGAQTDQTALLTKTIDCKDTIIASFHKENTDLREALEGFNDEDEEDVIEEDDEEVAVGAKLPGISLIANNKAVALQDQLFATRKALDEVKDKIPSDAYILLLSMLQPVPGKRNVN